MAQRKVTTIPATRTQITSMPITEQTKRKVAGYARVSTDHDDQFTSYEAQIDYYTNYIKARDDWEFVGVYTDEGITGTSTKHREGFKRMVADALTGKIDLIITKSVSRFARNTVDSLSTIRQLKENGTECYFEKENIWTFDGKGELLITIMSSLAQEESRSISENCTWGQRKRFSDGKVTVPFKRFLGYDRGPNGELVINQEQAAVVRKIYQLFLEGKTPSGIATQLTREGIKSPAGKDKWSQSTVKSILQNEKYKGDALLQKTFTTDFLTKKTKVNEGEIPQYYVEGDHEAIIDPDTFEMVQREMAQRNAGRYRHSGIHTFSGKIKCGECGSWYGSKVWHSNDKYRRVVWQCNHKFEGDTKCHTPHLTDGEIEEKFVSAVNQLLKNRDSIIADIDLVKASVYDTDSLSVEHGRLSDELALVTELVQKAITENAHHALDQREYQQRYDALTERYNVTKAQLDAVTEQIKQKELSRAALTDFQKALRSRKAILTKFDPEAWCTLVDYATVYSKDDIRFTFKNGLEIKS
ncbi:MAG: recombinase family protein [Clostridiales bacterium]|nr:recombinase family protein [Clostridiales bacterium]